MRPTRFKPEFPLCGRSDVNVPQTSGAFFRKLGSVQSVARFAIAYPPPLGAATLRAYLSGLGRRAPSRRHRSVGGRPLHYRCLWGRSSPVVWHARRRRGADQGDPGVGSRRIVWCLTTARDRTMTRTKPILLSLLLAFSATPAAAMLKVEIALPTLQRRPRLVGMNLASASSRH